MQLIDKIDWQKVNDLIPVIIQDNDSGQVLMLGYMNQQALTRTVQQQKVVFYSRTKKRLWMKGETSGNFLMVKHISVDCDQDTLLVQVQPVANTCHKGNASCFDNDVSTAQTLSNLERVIMQRARELPAGSYTTSLFNEGLNRIAQKVGEEAVEVVIAALAEKNSALISESADLFYHVVVLLVAKGVSLNDVFTVMASRVR